jgi:hypothetical protein
MDRFGNLGKNRGVRWSATAVDDASLLAVEAVIRPQQGQTTQQGVARAVISSPTGGTFICTVVSESSKNAVDFAPIEFAPPPLPNEA